MTMQTERTPTPSALDQLTTHGQSVWLDYISRGLVGSGELKRLVDQRHVTGLTSNPTIFAKAIGDGTGYDEQLDSLLAAGMSDPDALYIELTATDIQRAADVLRPIYDATDGQDGFVSIEVPPSVAHDAGGSLAIGRFLWDRVDRPNTLVKVPATTEGNVAIEQLITCGVNVNITLIFAVSAYGAVVEAYLRGLEARMRAKLPVTVRSVASFFVSRVDTAVDALLEERLNAEQGNREVRSLLGKAAIANARIAYEAFERAFAGDRFATLREAGAAVQRPLWASTSAKNPAYRDVVYAEALIAPDTIDTMPLATIDAFAEHGVVAGDTAEQNIDEAHETIRRLGAVGINMEKVTADLLDDGLRAFAGAYDGAVNVIASKIGASLKGRGHHVSSA
jgi:transaldolase